MSQLAATMTAEDLIREANATIYVAAHDVACGLKPYEENLRTAHSQLEAALKLTATQTASTEAEDSYDAGYQDGLEDAAKALVDLEHYAPNAATKAALTEAIQSVRKMQGWVECSDCNGTGDNTKPTTQDFLKAMMSDAGAVVSVNFSCRSCFGYGVTKAARTGEAA